MTDAVTAVCVTTYPARAHFLADALAAYAGQDLPAADRRLVVINDGPVPLVSARADVVVRNVPPGRSLGWRRQAGLELVATPWFSPWDDDDFALPEHFATLRDAAVAAGRSFAMSGRAIVADADLVARVVVPTGGHLVPAVVARADVARRRGGYPDLRAANGADTRMLNRLGRDRLLVDAATYLHRRHPANGCHQVAAPRESVWDRALRLAAPAGTAGLAEVTATVRRLRAAAPTLVAPA